MTIPEAKASIVAQVNQLAVNALTDELAKAVVQVAELTAKVADLEQKLNGAPPIGATTTA